MNHFHQTVQILLEQIRERQRGSGTLVHIRCLGLQPTLDERQVTNIGVIDVQDSSSRDCGWGGIFERMDLKDHAHGVAERNSLIGDKGQHLVVVHHRVHALDPAGVNVTIQHNPLVGLDSGVRRDILGHVAHDYRDHTISPILCESHVAIQLISCN